MAAGSTRGSAGASVEVLVGVGAEAAVEADLAIGVRFKLAISRRKDGYYAARRWNRPNWSRTRYG
ncbi:MAG TPA: hypothetical protein VJJ98_05335 [Sedimentisphaerales bacterium]|nr:hypothetical protein [Sedimentisphaerales bacterium]